MRIEGKRKQAQVLNQVHLGKNGDIWLLFKTMHCIKKIILILLLGQLSCVGDDSVFPNNRKFIGFWGETRWIYQFDQEGKYVLESEGHLGGESKSGRYIKKDSLIILLPSTDYFESTRLNRLKIINRECLRDYSNYMYCMTEDRLIETSEGEFEKSLQMERIIEELEVVQSKRREIVRGDSLSRPFIRFAGIVLINSNEYYEYLMESRMTNYYRYQVHLRLYSKFDPIRIYNDSLKLIKKYEPSTNTR